MIDPRLMQQIMAALQQIKGQVPGGLPNPTQFPPGGVQAQTPPGGPQPDGPPNPGQFPPTGVPAMSQLAQGMQGAMQGPMGQAQGPMGAAQPTGGPALQGLLLQLLGPIMARMRMGLGGQQ